MSSAVQVRLWSQPVATTRKRRRQVRVRSDHHVTTGQPFEPVDVRRAEVPVLQEHVARFEHPDLDRSR